MSCDAAALASLVHGRCDEGSRNEKDAAEKKERIPRLCVLMGSMCWGDLLNL